jgi:hypothetical protein
LRWRKAKLREPEKGEASLAYNRWRDGPLKSTGRRY